MAERDDSRIDAVRVELTEHDIPGAVLSTPFENHTVPAWLFC